MKKFGNYYKSFCGTDPKPYSIWYRSKCVYSSKYADDRDMVFQRIVEDIKDVHHKINLRAGILTEYYGIILPENPPKQDVADLLTDPRDRYALLFGFDYYESLTGKRRDLTKKQFKTMMHNLRYDEWLRARQNENQYY